MRGSTILLTTFLVWLTAKGKVANYWALATTSNASNGVGPNAGASHAAPAFGTVAWATSGWNNVLFGDLFK